MLDGGDLFTETALFGRHRGTTTQIGGEVETRRGRAI